MSFFNLDPQASEQLYERAKLNPVTNESFGYSLTSDLKAPFLGLAAAVNDAVMLGADAATPTLKETFGKSLDTIFDSGTTVQDWIEKQRKLTHDAARYLTPDPLTSSVVGQAVHGLFEMGPQAIGGFLMGGPAGSAALVGGLQANKAMQLAADEGVDAATALGVGLIQGGSAALGAFVPMSLAPALTAGLGAGFRATANVSFGAAVQSAQGMVSRGATSKLLEERGYSDMAKQYEAFDRNAILTDIVLGGAFGYVGHRMSVLGEKPEPSKRVKISQNDVDLALAANNAHHVEIDTAPGLPTSPEARQAHVDSLNKALQDMMGGEPVDVGAAPTLVQFDENPGATAARNEIGSAISQFLDLPVIEARMTGTMPRVEAALPNSINGAETAIRIENDYYPARYVLVDAGELAATLEKSDNQFRNRNRAASKSQIAKIANEPDFNLLNAAPIMDYGSPTMTIDGLIVAGNGRFEGVSRAYDQGTGAGYRASLERALPKFGFEPTAAAGMKKPVLVRVIEANVDTQRVAIASNEGGGLSMSALERADVDSKRLPKSIALRVNEAGDISPSANADLIRHFTRNMSDQEIGNMVDEKGQLSVDGMKRLRNAVLYKAYGDSPVLARLVESLDPGSKNVAAALLRSAANAAEAKAQMEAGQMFPLDITPELIEAANKLEQLRASGEKVTDYLNQANMFDNLSIEARKILEFFGSHMRSSKTMGDMLGAYWAKAQEAGNPSQETLIPVEPPSKAQILDAALAEARKTAPTASAELPFGDMVQGGLTAAESVDNIATRQQKTQQAEAKLQERLDTNFPELVKEYEQLPDSKGGKILNTDTARELSPDYMADRTLAGAVHEPASDFIKQLYTEKLSKPTPEGVEPIVVFSGGGAGAGKSTGLSMMGDLVGRAEMVYDTTLSGLKSSVERIEQALAADRNVRIVFTYRDILDSFINGALPRAMEMERDFGSGRTVPFDYFAKSHLDARATVEVLMERYAKDPRVEFTLVDNSRGFGNQAVVDLASLPKETHNNLGEKLYEALKKERDSGRISTEVFRGFSEGAGEPAAAARGAGEPGYGAGQAVEGAGGPDRAGDRGGAAQDGRSPQGTEGRAADAGQDAYNVNQLIAEKPDLQIAGEDGQPIPAANALAQADAEIAMAKRESQGYDAAVACALRG